MNTNDMQAAVVSSAGCTSGSVMALRQLPLQGRLAKAREQLLLSSSARISRLSCQSQPHQCYKGDKHTGCKKASCSRLHSTTWHINRTSDTQLGSVLVA
jgi:hypothetical protein